jgi:hypothetical protein
MTITNLKKSAMTTVVVRGVAGVLVANAYAASRIYSVQTVNASIIKTLTP